MAARSIGSGTISIGLVTIPVKLYTATSGKGASFNLLHACPGGKFSRLKQDLRCEAENVIVERSDLVKGYQVSMDQFAVFTPEEIKALEAARPTVCNVFAFVPEKSIDPIYVEKTTLLGPDKNGVRGYALLAVEMKRKKRVALGTFASRSGKDVLVELRPFGEGLALHELFYSDEVRSLEDVEGVKGAADLLTRREAGLMSALIAKMNGRFEPEKYRDTWAEKIHAIAAGKLAGGDVAIPEPPATGQAAELLDALERSVAQSGPRKARPRAGRAA